MSVQTGQFKKTPRRIRTKKERVHKHNAEKAKAATQNNVEQK